MTNFKTVRFTIARNGCCGVIGLPAAKLHEAAMGRCPVCLEAFYPEHGGPSPCGKLCVAFDEVSGLSHRLAVEFVFPEEIH